MTPIHNGLRAASHESIWFLLLAANLLLAAQCDAAGQAAQSRPQIADVRIGIANHYKVGHSTPVCVELDPQSKGDQLRVEVMTADSDGVPTTASGTVQPAVSRDAVPTACIYTKVGRLGGDVRVKLFDGDQQLDERILQPGSSHSGKADFVQLPATSELAVIMGAPAFDLQEAFGDRNAADGHAARRVIRVDEVAQLPVDWFGYESVDLLIMAADESGFWQELAADETRFAALVRWIELGGRLVVLCDAANAPQLLAEGGPLASLIPGKFADVVRLPETGPLEHFANSEAPIVARGARTTLAVPHLIDVDGNIEVYAGRRPADLPLVVRSPRGLGEVAFVAVDPTTPPLSNWSGRTAFLEALLRPYLTQNDVTMSAAPQSLVTSGYNDLSGALRQRLGWFASVAPITFPLVTVLAIAYMLVLGPIDYVVIHRWLRRPWLAWVTFPLIVLTFGLTALAIAERRSGSGQPRVNRMELVDIDMATGQARGTFWAALHSPRAEQFNLSLDVDLPTKSGEEKPEVRLTWWGLPGAGIGGMQAKRTESGIIRTGYRFSPHGDAIEGLPVLTSATKSLFARWTASVDPPIEAQLSDQEGLAAGFIVNMTGRPLHNLRLFYNGWAFVLGNLEPGGRVDVSEENSPRRVKTIVTQSALGTTAPGQSDEGMFVAERASAEEILNLMMFYRAGGGYGFARLPNDYLTFCDLSRMPDLGRAVLVADVPTPGSRLIDTDSGEPLGDDHEATTVVYRFVVPVDR